MGNHLEMLDRVVELGQRMERPRSVSFRLSRSDYDILADYSSARRVSLDILVRGIVLSFIAMYGDCLGAAPSEEVQP